MNNMEFLICESKFISAFIETFALLGILLLYGIIGDMDYHDERMIECIKYDKDYDKEEDMCK